jgi:glycosyltransferase involved in cell wall biosynthesis
MSRKLNILYLSQYFPPEMGAPAARVYETTKYWVERGHEVTVVTGFPNHPTGIVPDKYRKKMVQKESHNGINLIRTYIYPTPNKGFFRRILNYFSFMFSSIFFAASKLSNPDVLIATSPQFLVGISGYILSKIKSCPFVLEIRDLWPESIVQLDQIRNSVIINVLRKMELFLYRNASFIIVAVDSFKSYLMSIGINENKIRIIRNGVDLDSFQPSSNIDSLKTRYNLQNKFVISYIGTIGLSHALDKVVEAAEKFSEFKDIQFLFIGEGAEKENLKLLTRSRSISNILFIDQVPKNEISKYYSISDVLLVTLRKIPLFDNALPSKMFEIMAMQKPIILCISGEAKKMAVDRARAAIYSEPENVSELVRSILVLKADKALREKLGKNGRDFVEKYLDRRSLSEKYLRIISGLVN